MHRKADIIKKMREKLQACLGMFAKYHACSRKWMGKLGKGGCLAGWQKGQLGRVMHNKA
jgi:hypothetical protein